MMRKVLVVDDYLPTCTAVAVLLEKLGCVAKTADGIEQALELAKENYDIIIVDLQLKGSSGLDLIKLLRKKSNLKNTNFVLFTGDTTFDLKYYKTQGVDAILPKPFNIDQLESLIAHHKPSYTINR